VVHTYNLSTQEANIGELKVSDQTGLHSETLPQNKTERKEKEKTHRAT
jgi:hypothetical protein